MASKKSIPTHLQAYCSRPSRRRMLVFWVGFGWQTVLRRRLSRVVAWRIGNEPIQVSGLPNLPKQGDFILAVNHYHGRPALDVIAALVTAANQARPELADEYMLVTGRRKRRKTTPPPLPASVISRAIDWAFHRWEKQVVRIPLGNERASIKTLREWRQRLKVQPAIVFPEGKARIEFGTVREGAGKWLAALHSVVIPVAVWWHAGTWQVHFGAPIQWSRRPELLDMQLGLNLAVLLPSELAPSWQPKLTQWREIHQTSPIMIK